ncbi:GNAT family N-acetyltransferase [Inconstantimicrobium porci]|uniref:GNAT family N-acetyltransferase n=1 Tax=Inconstantimicrobium porci TaxID=2652291 RepID=A0A7X2MZR9_9CLOT|nr:GNAT family N-acetyltransferase [Inconstantimicrobium porci]MDD6772281.1 GNAT family N-acetyltransferase [Inconstantimicrobium porci]MSR92048.1 GNAT family N-acetyltransferase [Inconstantimicrobium porci]
MIDELVQMDVAMYGEACGEDFCRRRAQRMGEEYLSDSSLNMYVCYLDGQPVGSCELYISNSVAKIESFTVQEEFQRRGIGTTILKYLMEEAKKQKADIRYLIADEDDTPKEMYKKLGFQKVEDTYSLFWKL